MFSERGFGGEAPDIMCLSKKTRKRFLFYLGGCNNLPSPDGEGGNRRVTGGEIPIEFLNSSLKSFYNQSPILLGNHTFFMQRKYYKEGI
jgi:hypothetical protein